MRQNSVAEIDKRTGDYMSRFMVSHKQKHVEQADSFQWALNYNDGDYNSKREHVANGCYSPGGDRFYFTKCGETDSMKIECKIYVSNFEKSKWTEPKLLGEGINLSLIHI